MDLSDMKPHEWPRKSESEFEFNLKEVGEFTNL